MNLSEADHTRISKAIDAAEAKTSGEIFCIFADHVADYRETPLAWAAGAALILPLGLIPLGFGPSWLPAWLPGAEDGWTIGQAAALKFSIGEVLGAYALVQAAVFALVLAIVSIPAIKRALTPKDLKRKRAHQAAIDQFLARGLHLTSARTGVLIFAARGERHAEIVADEGIHRKVGEAVWEETVATLTKAIGQGKAADGFVAAIERCGHVLTQHFPADSHGKNELPNEVIEI